MRWLLFILALGAAPAFADEQYLAPTTTPTPTFPDTRTPRDTPLPAACCGDCNGDGQVVISEVIAAVTNALNRCP